MIFCSRFYLLSLLATYTQAAITSLGSASGCLNVARLNIPLSYIRSPLLTGWHLANLLLKMSGKHYHLIEQEIVLRVPKYVKKVRSHRDLSGLIFNHEILPKYVFSSRVIDTSFQGSVKLTEIGLFSVYFVQK